MAAGASWWSRIAAIAPPTVTGSSSTAGARYAGSADFTVSGSIAPNGTVRASISHGSDRADVQGRLGHGIAGPTKTVALEVATNGITVNCISPGYVWTPLVERQIPDTMKARNLSREQLINDVLLEAQPTKQFVTVDQVAALPSFSVRMPPARSPAPTFPWTAAGRRNDSARISFSSTGRAVASRWRTMPALVDELVQRRHSRECFTVGY
jgi:hypothetical protein